MINLMKQPFFLSEKDIEWVENTKKHMTLEDRTVVCTDRIFRGSRISRSGHACTSHRRNHVSVRKGRGDAADTSVSSGK